MTTVRRRSGIRTRWLLVAGGALGFCVAPLGASVGGAQDRRLMSAGDMDAYLENGDCGRTGLARIRIVSADPAKFEEPRVELQRMVGGLAAALLGTECSRLSRITVTGISGGELYFAGVSDRSERWALLGLFAPPSASGR